MPLFLIKFCVYLDTNNYYFKIIQCCTKQQNSDPQVKEIKKYAVGGTSLYNVRAILLLAENLNMNPYYCFIKNKEVDIEFSGTMHFWNNIHQVRSKANIWKPNNFKIFVGQEY